MRAERRSTYGLGEDGDFSAQKRTPVVLANSSQQQAGSLAFPSPRLLHGGAAPLPAKSVLMIVPTTPLESSATKGSARLSPVSDSNRKRKATDDISTASAVCLSSTD
jgi:hypothetical protein